MECIGLGLGFLVLNVFVVVAAILVSRIGGGRFVSLSAADDITIGVLSLLQGACFRLWRRQSDEEHSQRLRP